jgi:hypothetical protein
MVTTAGATWSTTAAYESKGPPDTAFPLGSSLEADPVPLRLGAYDWHAAHNKQAATTTQNCFISRLLQVGGHVKPYTVEM